MMNQIEELLYLDPQTQPQTGRCHHCGQPVYPSERLCGHCRRDSL